MCCMSYPQIVLTTTIIILRRSHLNQCMVYNYVNLACYTDKIVPIFTACDKNSMMYIVVCMGYIYVWHRNTLHTDQCSCTPAPSLHTTYRTKTQQIHIFCQHGEKVHPISNFSMHHIVWCVSFYFPEHGSCHTYRSRWQLPIVKKLLCLGMQ